MKKIFIAMLFLFQQAQVNAQSVSYSYNQNDPYRYNYHANLLLFDVEHVNNQSTYLGYGLQGSLAFRKLLSVDFLYNRAYSPGMDLNYHQAAETIYTVCTTNEPRRFRKLELGGMFHLSVTMLNHGNGKSHFRRSLPGEPPQPGISWFPLMSAAFLGYVADSTIIHSPLPITTTVRQVAGSASGMVA